jgi:peptide/nickel transport system permease protein
MSSTLTYQQAVWQRFLRQRSARWAIRGLFFALFIALMADFLANDKPLFCQINGKTYFPVIQSYAVQLGWSHWDTPIATGEWSEQQYTKVWYPLIPYSNTSIDHHNLSTVSPLEHQEIASWRFRHWLGTDVAGHDVTAALIHGVRTALSAGLIAMLVASLIGIFLGALAGYYGDDQLFWSRGQVFFNLLFFPLGLFYGFGTPHSPADAPLGIVGVSLGIIWLLVFIFLGNLLAIGLQKTPWLNKKMRIPIDSLVNRLIEIFDSIPTMLLIISMAAILAQPNIFYAMAIIGLISWTGIARLLRAEMLKVRQQQYIEAAQALGYSHGRIIFRHAIPNALPPVLIAIAFGMASAILIEASLSVLGIGVAADAVTWGALLRQVSLTYNPEWWLAVFPGLAIFFSVLLFNYLGDGLSRAMDK